MGGDDAQEPTRGIAGVCPSAACLRGLARRSDVGAGAVVHRQAVERRRPQQAKQVVRPVGPAEAVKVLEGGVLGRQGQAAALAAGLAVDCHGPAEPGQASSMLCVVAEAVEKQGAGGK